jgi:hypothetical protein
MRIIALLAFAYAGVVCAQVPTIAVSPASASVMTQATKQFTATVLNSADQVVIWSVNGIAGGNSVVGGINSTGRYVAPAQVPTPAVVQVQARSASNSLLMTSSPVTVTPPVPTINALSPAGVPADVFTTKVNGIGFVSGAVAKLNNVPLATTYNGYWQVTASGTSPAPGTYQLTVTNPDGKVSNSTSLVVMPVKVTVTPGAVSLAGGASQGFVATVTNTKDSRANWYVNNILGGSSAVGTVNSLGLYTAPHLPTAATVIVSAASVISPAAKASASAAIQPSTSSASPTPTTPSPSTTTRYNKMGVVNYVTPWLKPAAQDALFAFQKDKYDLFLGGASGTRHSPDAVHAPYNDLAVLYNYDMNTLKDIAAKRGYAYEDMLLHMSVNYTLKAGLGWAMGRFDSCERWNGDNGTNGVFLLDNNDSTYVDKTSAAWNTATADVPITKRVLLGYCEPFDQASFTLSTAAGSGISVAWEYWNGAAWARLTLLADATNGLKQNGTVRFLPPANWAMKAENGSRKKWWVRATVSGIGSTPVASRILADDWSVPGHPTTWRGWDKNAPGRINVGLGPLEYNPNPPAGATARFRYQARFGGAWAINLQFGNPANTQGGQRTWANYLIDNALPTIQAMGANGIFFDDAEAMPTILSPANWQNYTEMAGLSMLAERTKTYAAARDYLRTQLPGAKVCTNTATWELAKEGDCFLAEYAADTHTAGTFGYNVIADKTSQASATYDQLLPENNPSGTKGVFTAWDLNSDLVVNGQYVIWDRVNRGPMTGLAAYYIVANENTRFGYHTERGWLYYKTDEFAYVDPAPNFYISAPLTADMNASTVKYISGDFTAFPAEYTSPDKRVFVKIGQTGEVIPAFKVSNTKLGFADVLGYSYPAGTGIYFIREGHLATDPLPPMDRMMWFCKWFPAAGVDIGSPDSAGHNAGVRNLAWKPAAESGTALGVRRRDFTKAIVLHAPGANNILGSVLAQQGSPLALGGTYYPLLANGKTGPGVTSIRLRTAEGAILMKAPVL